MKQATITLFVVFLLLTVVTASVAGLGINDAVMDVKGRPVKAYKPYFIQLAGQPGEWVSRHRRFIDIPCPTVAVVSTSPMSVTFLLESGAEYVPLATNLSIIYNKLDFCPSSDIWRVDTNSPFPTPDITATGALFTPDSTFKIQKENEFYKFVYESSNVGVFTDPTTNIEHLVLNPTSLDVIFVPANEPGYKTSSYLKTMVPHIY